MSSNDGGGTATPDRSGTDGAFAAASEPDASEAFQALGNEVRMTILETMLERVDGDGPSRTTFSELFDATDLETSAQFAYHLEQLVGPYLRKTDGNSTDRRSDGGYEFTYAGSKIARAIATGAYTRSVTREPVALETPCPFCGTDALDARSADNVVTIACGACDRTLSTLQFPPSGLEAHGADLPEAFDRHHRHRFALMRDGVCPECSGDVRSSLVTPTDDVADELPEELVEHAQAAFECRQCGHDVRCPVTLALLEHPAVVSFYYDHGYDVRDRPIWNVGHEWAETVLSDDPWCVRVVTELEDDVLALYVDETVDVVEVQRTSAAEDEET
jgi:hypothetical protein